MKRPRACFEEIVCGVLLAVILISVTIQVVNRSFVKASMPWTEELARYCFVWLSFVGISMGVKRSGHMNVDLINNALGPRGRLVVGLFCDLLFVVLCLYVAYHGMQYVAKLRAFGQKSGGMGLQMWLVYLAAPVGMGLSVVRIVEKNIRRFRQLPEDAGTGEVAG